MQNKKQSHPKIIFERLCNKITLTGLMVNQTFIFEYNYNIHHLWHNPTKQEFPKYRGLRHGY